MLSLPLLKRELKANYKLFIIIIGVLSLYISMILYMYDPLLGDSLTMMAKSMPEIFAAFGMLDVGNTLTDFAVNYLYGFLLVLFPVVFTVILSNKLIVKYVDRGSMAYLLSTPNNRFKIALTQAKFLGISIFALVAYVTSLGIVLSEVMFKGELDIPKFIIVNIGLYCLHIFISGICFLSSCVFNDARLASGVGAGVVILFILIQMVSQVGDKLANLKYFTPMTLFDAKGIMRGADGIYLQLSVLFVVGIIFYSIGIWIFTKKDLPL